MKNKNNKKAEIATILTLGVILVGTVLTIATSFFANKTKNLASNPKAALIATKCYLKDGQGSCPPGQYQFRLYGRDVQCGGGLKYYGKETISGDELSSKYDLVSGNCYKLKGSGGSGGLSGSAPTKSNDSSSNSTPAPTSIVRLGKYLGSGNAYLCQPNNNVSFRGYTLDGNGCDVRGNLCPNDALPFACYVVDDRCNGEPRYSWYGCLGQPCQNTKINQGSRGPGHLVGIPNGMQKNNSMCQNELATPTPTTPLPGGGSPAGGTSPTGKTTPGASVPTPTYTPIPTPPLLTETGIWANSGELIIENVTNNETLRLNVVSLGTNYDYLSIDILPRQSYTYNYSRFCSWLTKRLSGHIAYYSSEDNFQFAKFKSIALSCDNYLLIGIE